MILVNGKIKAKRGVHKAFRQHLNAAYPEMAWRAGSNTTSTLRAGG